MKSGICSSTTQDHYSSALLCPPCKAQASTHRSSITVIVAATVTVSESAKRLSLSGLNPHKSQTLRVNLGNPQVGVKNQTHFTGTHPEQVAALTSGTQSEPC